MFLFRAWGRDGYGEGNGVLGSVFFALPRDWAPKDLGNELGRAHNLFRGRKELAKRVATSSPLDAAASINKSINYCESCSQCSQYASAPPPLHSAPACLCPCPSFIRIFQLTFKRRAFPLRCCDCLRLTDPAPSCPEPGLY